MSKTWKPTFVLAVLLATIAAGCGGGSGESESGTTSTAAKVAANERFTATEWQKYQTDAAAFKSVNDKALNRVSVCSKKINPEPGAVEKCVGDTLTNLSVATKTVDQDLQSFTGSVGGACLTALTDLLNYVQPYEASIAALQNTIATNNSAAAYNSVTTLTNTRAAGQQKNAAVAAACAPA